MKLGSQTNSKEVKYFYKMSKNNLPVSQKLSENCPKSILKIVQKDRLKNSPQKSPKIFIQKSLQKSTKTIYPKITQKVAKTIVQKVVKSSITKSKRFKKSTRVR